MEEKSRNISLVDYYSTLQLEFISFFTRSKTYKKDYAETYAKICDGKKQKILNISLRNNLPSIFDNKNIKEKYIDKFLNKTGSPNFQYKDEDIRNRMQCWDNYNFFSRGISVKIVLGEDIILGTVDKNNIKNQVLTIKIPDTDCVVDFHYSNVARLFPEDFFNF